MKALLFYSLFIMLPVWGGGPIATDAHIAHSSYDFSMVDAYVDAHADVYDKQLAILVSQNGAVIYQKEVNLSIKAKRLIASASKWLSGAVIMALVDERKLSLDDTVGQFMPVFTAHHKGNITIRQLFSHTSGFPGNSPQRYEFSRKLTLAQAVDSIAVYTDLVNPPGTAFNYGGVSMHIAGRIAEIVSGKTWQELFDEKIGTPCHMQVRYLIMNPQNPMIAGGARTSARDYLNFVEMLVNKGLYQGKRVLSERAVAEMVKDQTAGAEIQSTPYPANPFSTYANSSIRYGIGNWRDVVTDEGIALETSSPGYFGTHPWQHGEDNVAGIIFTRTEGAKTQTTSLTIRKMIRDVIEKG